MNLNDMHFKAANQSQTLLRFAADYAMLRFGKDSCVACANGHMACGAVLRTLKGKVNVVVVIDGQCCSENVLRYIQSKGATIIASSEVENLAGYSDGIRVYDPKTMQGFPETFAELLAKTKPHSGQPDQP
jgi:hypothetical protein